VNKTCDLLSFHGQTGKQNREKTKQKYDVNGCYGNEESPDSD